MQQPGPVLDKGPFSRYKIWIIVGLVVILAAVAGIFSYSKSKVSNSTSVSTAKAPSLRMKELGVEIKLVGSLAGTTYKVVKPSVPPSSDATLPTFANLSTNKYTDLANQCTANKVHIDYPYVTLLKITGKAPASDKQLLKQFNGFYIEKATSVQSLSCKDKTAYQKTMDSLSKEIDSDLQSAFNGAVQV